MARRQAIRRLILFLLVLLFPVVLNYYSPYLIIQASSEGVANFPVFLWSTWAISSLFLGRLGCAWICPLGGAQMLTYDAAGKALKRIRGLRWIKRVLAILWVRAIVYVAVFAGGYKSINLLYNTEGGISVDSAPSLIMALTIVAVPIIPAFILGRRAFCHYFCPFGVLNAVGTWISRRLRIPHLHLSANTPQCIHCGRCSDACPMSLPVREMVKSGDMADADCILCASCVDTRPKDVIGYAFGREEPKA